MNFTPHGLPKQGAAPRGSAEHPGLSWPLNDSLALPAFECQTGSFGNCQVKRIRRRAVQFCAGDRTGRAAPIEPKSILPSGRKLGAGRFVGVPDGVIKVMLEAALKLVPTVCSRWNLCSPSFKALKRHVKIDRPVGWKVSGVG